MHFVNRRLVRAFDNHFINVHVRGAAGDPGQRVGDVFRRQWLDTFIHFPGSGSVSFEADDREFSFGHAGINCADANARAA